MGHPGDQAITAKGWWAAHRWLLLRRSSQLGLLAGFLAGPLGGFWLLDGNFAASVVLGGISLAEPFVLAQQLAAGYHPPLAAISGALILVGFYAVFGGRLFCSWVCPVNLVTDAAALLRRRLGLPAGRTPPRSIRYGVLAGVLAGAAAGGALLWENVNPVTLLPREVLFGSGSALAVIAAVFFYDLLVAQRGWCGHLCPMGAFYSVIGRFSLVRVSARKRSACTDCADCYVVCPEPQVIKPALKGRGTPVILSPNCTNCGRCIDVCGEKVFTVALRFDRRVDGPPPAPGAFKKPA